MTVATTEAAEVVKPMTCSITGLPYVRKITFEDKGADGRVPVHVLSGTRFDGQVPTAPLAGSASIDLDSADGTVVSLIALTDEVAPPFVPSDPREGTHAPGGIGEHVFLCPAERPWEAVGDGMFTRCYVFVGEVEVR